MCLGDVVEFVDLFPFFLNRKGAPVPSAGATGQAKDAKGVVCWFCYDPGRETQDHNTPSPDGRLLLQKEGRGSNLLLTHL